MKIEDINIKIKKYDREKSYVLVNVEIFANLEIRGFIARYTTTKHTTHPIWLVTPPSLPIGKGKFKKYFWVVEFKDTDFWEQLQQRIIRRVIEYTNFS